MQKTIFISILSGIEAKNILRTNVLSTLLKEADFQIVLFLKSKERVALYRREFHHPNLVYEVVGAYQSTWLDCAIEFLKHYLVRTKTLFLYKRLVFTDTKNWLAFAGSTALSWVLGWRFWRRIVRFIDYYFIRSSTFVPYLDHYHPDAVFLANLFDGMETSLLREALRRGIATIGFINSWDKVTSKGFVRLLSRKLMVPNSIVKQEAVEFVDARPEDITVVGHPQYDFYVGGDGLLSREEFFWKIGMDLAKKLIVFGPMGLSFSNSDWEMIDLLRYIVEKELQYPAALLVRFQPNEHFPKEEFEKRPWLKFDLPGIRFSTERGIDWDMTGEELLHLKNTLFHCDLLISYASSIGIDAAIFDKPVINIGFEIMNGQPAIKTPTLRYKTAHYQKALASGGIRLVKSRRELIQWINVYLGDSTKDQEGRERLVREQCGVVDGKSGERIAKVIMDAIKA